MITNEEVIACIRSSIDCEDVIIKSDGSHFEAIVVSEVFAGKRPVQKQQTVYAAVNEHISSGAIHALTIKAYTPEEWKTAKKLQVG